MYLKQKDKRLGSDGQTMYLYKVNNIVLGLTKIRKRLAYLLSFFATKDILFIFGSIHCHVNNILNHTSLAKKQTNKSINQTNNTYSSTAVFIFTCFADWLIHFLSVFSVIFKLYAFENFFHFLPKWINQSINIQIKQMIYIYIYIYIYLRLSSPKERRIKIFKTHVKTAYHIKRHLFMVTQKVITMRADNTLSDVFCLACY